MKIPVDVGSVMEAVEETEKSRSLKFCIQILVDAAADPALIDHVNACFESQAPNAKVRFDSYDASGYRLPKKDADFCILVAGPSTTSAALYNDLLEAGFPSAIATLCPNLLLKMAQIANLQIDAHDVLSPFPMEQGTAESEPQAFGDEEQGKLDQALGMWMASIYPEKRLAFASAFPFLRYVLAVDSVRATAMQNGGIGLIAFIPGADMPLMTLNECKMVLQIASAYGQEIGKERIRELIAVVGSGFVLRGVARQVVGILPAFGSLAKAGIGYSGTLGLGYAFIEYFEQGGDIAALADKAMTTGREIASGKRQLKLPSDFEQVKANALGAVGTVVDRAVPIAKGIGEVLMKNGLDADKLGHAAGFAVETVIATALKKFR